MCRKKKKIKNKKGWLVTGMTGRSKFNRKNDKMWVIKVSGGTERREDRKATALLQRFIIGELLVSPLPFFTPQPTRKQDVKQPETQSLDVVLACASAPQTTSTVI